MKKSVFIRDAAAFAVVRRVFFGVWTALARGADLRGSALFAMKHY